MVPDSFIDTNILIRAVERKPDDARKSAIARHLVGNELFGVSAQTVAEFVNVSSRARIGLPASDIELWIDRLSSLPFTVVDADIVRRGFWMHRRYQIEYYDGALLAAAERLGAPVFYTEDLNHNQVYGTVRAVNPFL